VRGVAYPGLKPWVKQTEKKDFDVFLFEVDSEGFSFNVRVLLLTNGKNNRIFNH
jgi:hypothetical protein